MPKYNGFASWTQWNVSLWLNNDENLYRMMRYCTRGRGRDAAAEMLQGMLPETTPDGARYSKTAIKTAMRGL